MFLLFRLFTKLNYKFLLYILLLLFIIIFLLILILIVKYIILYNFYIKKNICIKSNNIWYKNLIKLNINNKFIFYKINNYYIFNFIYYNIGIPPVYFEKLLLITNNNKLINLIINDIKLAKKNIYIIFYIWEPGYLSNKIILELIKASKRGVKCKIILDAIGSINFFKTDLPLLMSKKGIKIVKYLELNLNNIIFKRFDIRQHKKIILIDNKIIYTGGMNLIDDSFFNKNIKLGIWIDLMVRIKSRLLGNIINIIFSYDWELQTGINILKKKINFYDFNNINNLYKDNLVQVITSGPGLPRNIIHRFLLNLIFSSKYRIIITTPYFIPSNSIIDAICTVSSKGINVSIIIPEKNDTFLIYWSSRFFFYDLIKSGVKIYLFKGNFLHTKLILIDYNISVLGTINFDFRSIWLNYEIALLIKSFFLNKKLFIILKKYMNYSKLINLNYIKDKKFYEKFLEKFFILFNPLL